MLYSILFFVGMVLFAALGVWLIYLFIKETDQKKSQEYKTGASFFIVIAIVCFFGGKFMWPSSSETITPSKTSSSSTMQQPTYPGAGQDAIITQQTFAATTQNSFDQLVQFSVAKNSDAIMRQIQRGEVMVLDQGTKVTVLDRTIGEAHIEVLDQSHVGAKAYIVIEALKATN